MPPSKLDSTNKWVGHAAVVAGSNSVALVAVDGNGDTTNKTISVSVTGSAPRAPLYDASGNLTDNGSGQTYAWDAANRLISITQASGVTGFAYDGLGRRIKETLNGNLVRQWVWCGGAQPCEERDATNVTTRRFYAGMGEQIGGANYYYTKDHLGSVRELTDSNGMIHARYDYDPYGRISKVSGDLEASFGFTGFYRHQASGLNLTLYRVYSADLGRWLSRDPFGLRGGHNLYGYVRNNPINRIDLFGLCESNEGHEGHKGHKDDDDDEENEGLPQKLVEQQLDLQDFFDLLEALNSDDPPAEIIIGMVKSGLTDLGVKVGKSLLERSNVAATQLIYSQVNQAVKNTPVDPTINPYGPAVHMGGGVYLTEESQGIY